MHLNWDVKYLSIAPKSEYILNTGYEYQKSEKSVIFSVLLKY